jgi:glycosyltransferase involved in cell wall biosynthesis
MDLPQVSVVIDNYNYARFLKQCVESALAQDYPAERLQVIVVDDGSTDESLEVARGFSDHIQLIAQSNQGQPGAFNAGIAAAEGEIVLLMDSDDYWVREKARTVVENFAQPGIGIVQHPLLEVDSAGRPLHTALPRWPARYRLQDFLAGGAMIAATTGLAFRRELLREIGPIPNDIFFASDFYLIINGFFGADAVNLSQPLGYHRVHGSNNYAEGYTDPRKLRAALKTMQTFHRYLEPKLKARGLSLSPMYRLLDETDAKRREILLAMHEGDRRAAWDLWRQLFAHWGLTGLGFFRCATLLLALISPAFYLRFYDLYRTRSWLVRLRSRILPD